MAATSNTIALPDLIAGCLCNRRQNQELLYRQFYGYAMSVCLRYTPTRKSALEVLNDGFSKAFTQLDSYDLAQPFKSWLRQILINSAVDFYRKEARYPQQEAIKRVEQTTVAGSTDTFSQLAHEDLLALIQQLLPAYRMVFSMYVIDGFTHEEVATQLEITVSDSKSNLAWAREDLRVLLKQLNYDEYGRATR